MMPRPTAMPTASDATSVVPWSSTARPLTVVAPVSPADAYPILGVYRGTSY